MRRKPCKAFSWSSLEIIATFSLVFLVALDASPITNPFRADGDITKVIPDHFDRKSFKAYHNSTPHGLKELPVISYNSPDPDCNVGFKLAWSSSVGSPVYSSPVIFPSGPEGKKQIFLSTFHHHIEVLGHDGYKPSGWPLTFEDSTFQGSPMLYDIDGDGTNDVGIVDKNGNLFWIRIGEYGQYLEDYHIQVPKLKIKRDWATGLDPKFTDNYVLMSMFDHTTDRGRQYGYDSAAGKPLFKKQKNDSEKTGAAAKIKPDDLGSLPVKESLHEVKPSVTESSPHGRRLLAIDENEEEEGARVEHLNSNNENRDRNADGHNENRAENQINNHDENGVGNLIENRGAESRNEGQDVRVERRVEDSPAVFIESTKDAAEGTVGDSADRSEKPLEEIPPSPEGSDSPELDASKLDGVETDDYITPHPHYGSSTESSYDGRGRGGRAFDDIGGYYSGGRGAEYNDSNFVFVDPHVLGSPVLVDINSDGHVEVLVAVSYYFDKEEYSGRELDFDPSLYVAGGIACWDLQSQDWTWLVHLDLTTDKTTFKALIYSTPTVADLDGDGRSEIVLGTSMGLLYLLDGDNGFVKRFFPMQFHEIQAQVAVADVVGGPALEMIVADMGGTVAVVNWEGEILWDANLSGTLPHTPTIGDVDGDGQVDIAIVAASADGTSHLWVLRGDTGIVLPGYPMSLPSGAIASASVLLVDLHDYSKEAKLKASKMSKDKVMDPSMMPWMAHAYGYEPPPSQSVPVETISVETIDANGTVHVKEVKTGKERRKITKSKEADLVPKSKGLHVVVPSFDGHIYVIDGLLKCAERIDIGEHIYSTPLMADVSGDGLLDLVVGTLSGQVHLLTTSVPSHALNSWTSFPNNRLNGFQHGVMGVSVPIEQRTALSRASFITYAFGISVNQSSGEKLKFSDFLGNRDMAVTFDIWDSRPSVPDRMYKVTFTRGTNKLSPLASREFNSTGRHTVLLSLFPPEKFVLVIGLTNEHGQYFEDTVPVELGTRFYVWMKYLLLLPALLMYVPLLSMRAKPKRKI